MVRERTPRRWLVLGAGGQVGGALCERLGDAAIGSRRTGLFAFDFLQAPAGERSLLSLLERTAPDVVVIAAAMTNVDRCEEDREEAWICNVSAPQAVATAAASQGVRVVYVSTDYVFDGVEGPYDERDTPNPLGVYGATKLAGERAVLDIAPDSLVVRTTVVWGPETVGRNFAYRLGSVLGAGRHLKVPADQYGTPTYNRDLADGIVDAVEAARTGIAHIAGSELCDRYTFAVRLASCVGLDTDLIQPVATADLGQTAVRPLRAGLVSQFPLCSRTVEVAAQDWVTSQRGAIWPSAARRQQERV